MNTPIPKQNIIPRLADIRPVRPMRPMKETSAVSKPAPAPIQTSAYRSDDETKGVSFHVKSSSYETVVEKHIVQLGASRLSHEVPYFHRATYVPRPIHPPRLEQASSQSNLSRNNAQPVVTPRISPARKYMAAKKIMRNEPDISKHTIPSRQSISPRQSIAPASQTKQQSEGVYSSMRNTLSYVFGRKFVFAFAGMAMVALIAIESQSLFSRGMKMKGEVLGVSAEGYGSLNDAVRNIKDRRFDQSATDFEHAADSFAQASQAFDEWNATLVDVSGYFPLLSKLSSGKNAMEAGKHIALAGQRIQGALSVLTTVKNPLDTSMNISLLEVFQKTQASVSQTKDELVLAQESLDKVKVDDVPEEKRARFVKVKTQLPVMIGLMNDFSDSDYILTDLLGGNGPRKYLFLFQNNHEMRATGGFIGSYALLDISNGRVRKFFVDGIFNPDGQLKENIVPPKPIQKMSAGWSLHDSNWFPDFPMSAEKAISFYEKTGGPTVDGVITLTPSVMQKLLKVTGPIRMDDYDVTLSADNFIEEVQQEVEVDYDKTQNKPKQILADFAPILLDRLMNVSDASQAIATAQAFEEGLGEKHILLYSRNAEVEKIIDDAGWSGKMLPAQKDYLSIINTNINGYKTDGVIDESIEHTAAIQDDGSVIDTVSITRKHNGGHEEKDWWNKVNADYLRVYVPKGSQLLDATGQTREADESLLDYDKLGFKRDTEIDAQESSVVVDPNTGTRVYDEAEKTVFANWAYVSPQETVTVTYRYKLPFKIQPETEAKAGFDSYSLILQKQSGSIGSRLVSSLFFPNRMNPVWQSSQNLLPYDGGLRFEGDLRQDRFVGAVFGK